MTSSVQAMRVFPDGELGGTIRVPGDKSISHRVAMLAGMFSASLLFNLYDAEIYASPLFHLFAGGTMLGAFFIATDPVTAATTPKGRLIYGALIGILAYTIRTWGGFPDGIAFGVLILNLAVPLIDQYTRPRVLGEGKL